MIVSILIDSVLPLFLLVLLGFLLNGLNIIKNPWVHTLNQFVYYVSLPALIITAFTNFRLTVQNTGAVLLNVGLLAVFSLVLFILLNLTRLSSRQKVTIFIASILGNTVYLGVPLYDSALSVDSSLSVAIASAILVSGIAYSMIAIEYWEVRSRQVAQYFADLIKNPLFISIAIGLLINLLTQNSGLTVPVSVKTSLGMLAGTASPIALVALGAFLYSRFSMQHLIASSVSSLIKLVLLPAFVWAGLSFLNVSEEVLSISVAASGMPLAITGFVLADKYQLNEAEVVNTLLTSTVLSFITLPLLIGLL